MEQLVWLEVAMRFVAAAAAAAAAEVNVKKGVVANVEGDVMVAAAPAI